MKITAKIYNLGKSGRMAVMLPKGTKIAPGDYEMDIPALDVIGTAEVTVSDTETTGVLPVNTENEQN